MQTGSSKFSSVVVIECYHWCSCDRGSDGQSPCGVLGALGDHRGAT